MLDDIPAIVRLFFVLLLIFSAMRKGLSLGNSFLVGSVLICLFFGLNPGQAYHSIVTSVTNPKTVALAVVVSLILILSNSMEAAGQMKRLFHAYQGLISHPKINLVILPALIGLLPMPGGAVFSAPMLKALGEGTDLQGKELSYINNWFRHIWEYWWPMYPGVLLTVTLSGLNLWYFVFFMLPLTVLSAWYGFFPLRSRRLDRDVQAFPLATKAGPFLRELTPVIIVIGVGLLAGFALSTAFSRLTAAKELGLFFSLLLAIGWVIKTNHLTQRELIKICTQPELLQMIYMVLAILIFKGLIEESGAVAAIAGEFQRLGLPLVLIAALLPLVVGVAVGITIGTMGATLPIIISLIHGYGEGSHMLAYMMLSLSWGFLGNLVSPLHICLTLSNQYFATSLPAVWRLLFPPTFFTMSSALLYFYLLKWLM